MSAPELAAHDEQAGMEAVRRVVRAHAPGADAARVDVLGEGQGNVAFLVDGRLIVRLTKETDRARAAARVEHDARLLTVVADISPLPVPVPVFTDAGEGCIAYERLPGVPLLDMLYGDERPRALGRSASVGGVLGVVLRELHATPRERVEEVVDDDDIAPAEWLAEARKHHRLVRGEVPRARARAIEAWALEGNRDRPDRSDADA